MTNHNSRDVSWQVLGVTRFLANEQVIKKKDYSRFQVISPNSLKNRCRKAMQRLGMPRRAASRASASVLLLLAGVPLVHGFSARDVTSPLGRDRKWTLGLKWTWLV